MSSPNNPRLLNSLPHAMPQLILSDSHNHMAMPKTSRFDSIDAAMFDVSPQNSNNEIQVGELDFFLGSAYFILDRDNILDKTITKIGFGFYQDVMFIINALALAIFWLVNLLPGFLLSNPRFQKDMSKNPMMITFIVCLNATFTLISNNAVGSIADHYGRRYPLLGTLFVATALLIGAAFASNVILMIICLGAGAGVASSLQAICPAYFLEICPYDTRGRYGTVLVFLSFTGYTLGAFTSYFLFQDPKDIAGLAPWRWFILISVVFPLFFVLVLCLSFAEESPRYLFKTSQADECVEVLKNIATRNSLNANEIVPTAEEVVQSSELLGILHSTENEGKEFFQTIREAVQIVFEYDQSVWLFCLQAFGLHTGPIVVNFATFFIPNMNLTGVFALTALIGLIPMVGVWFLVDNPSIGRLALLRVFGILGLISSIPFAVTSNPTVLVVSFSCFMFFAVPAGSLIILIIPEAYPTEIRILAMSVLVSLACIYGFFSILVFGLFFLNLPPFASGILLVAHFTVCVVAAFMISNESDQVDEVLS